MIGFLAAASTVAAFSCSRMVALRLAAIAANVLFIAYGSALGLMPVLLLHCILLPVNLMRLHRCIKDRPPAGCGSPDRVVR
jgi:energy-converting hydrogenase Eha subunit E